MPISAGVPSVAKALPTVKPFPAPLPTGPPSIDFPISGTFTATQANQTLVAAAGPVVGGALTATQGNQTLASAGGPVVGGALTATQADQALSAVAGVVVGGTFTATQANQTLVAAAGPIVGATFAATQGNQTLSSAGGILVGGTFTATQGNQLLGAAGIVVAGPVTGVFNGTQANDILAATAAVVLSRFNPQGIIAVVDVLPNRSPGFVTAVDYGTVPSVGQAFNLIVSVGSGITALHALHFTAPDGSKFDSDNNFLFVGVTPLAQTEGIDAFAYVVYQAGVGEFNQIGPWQVVVDTAGRQYGPFTFVVGS